ncbi:BtpA/SgcQ family protein [Tropicimonas isoalkanivorans]|uniref:Predicted TIM-barrel enzyme n=1 Tax=Tropicimonas isoalkanivorans TaxID=441112 RepID=A0A1I1HDC7_9RHOB|nr:BtpA/SgcQ family protein [Tropicimonas isoalkanivorans]SFC21851.1 Predicted TIM-barrel enzyme [Tropicimonas isoalkanivorans]
MSCSSFEQLLKSPEPIVTPVIHVLNVAQALANLDLVTAAGCPGAFLINHDFPMEAFLPILKEVRAARPSLWLGVNFLAQPGSVAFPVLGALAQAGCEFQAYWADDARIDERETVQHEAEEIARIRAESGWPGLYFGGVAFKKQRPVVAERYAESARKAAPFIDVVTTSGIATGHEADVGKVRTFRDALGSAPLALASGITPENVHRYCGLVDCFLVATGINRDGDFYTIDPARLDALLVAIRTHGGRA